MTVVRMSGGAVGGGLATGDSPPSKRRNSASQSLVAAGRGAVAGGDEVNGSDPPPGEPVLPVLRCFLSHSQTDETTTTATTIQKLSILPNIGMVNAESIEIAIGLYRKASLQFNCRMVWFALPRRPPPCRCRPRPRCCHAYQCPPGCFSYGKSPLCRDCRCGTPRPSRAALVPRLRRRARA